MSEPHKGATTRDFILWQKAEDFIDWIFPILDRFPKHEKFALTTQIKNKCYGILEEIVRTNKSRNKVPGLYEIDTQLELLQWLIRHSHKRKYLSHKSYEYASKKVSELGRIIGGLLKRGA